MEALRRSVGGAAAETSAPKKAGKKTRKAAAGTKEMLMPIVRQEGHERGGRKEAGREAATEVSLNRETFSGEPLLVRATSRASY
jgi:hypothetical protein